jgi:hypothetical protein
METWIALGGMFAIIAVGALGALILHRRRARTRPKGKAYLPNAP